MMISNVRVISDIRVLALVSLALFLIYNLLPFFWLYLYDYEILNLLVRNGESAIFESTNITSIFILVISVTSRVSLVVKTSWSRVMFIGVQVLSVFLLAVSGVSVASPLASCIGYTLVLVDGAILFRLITN